MRLGVAMFQRVLYFAFPLAFLAAGLFIPPAQARVEIPPPMQWFFGDLETINTRALTTFASHRWVGEDAAKAAQALEMRRAIIRQFLSSVNPPQQAIPYLVHFLNVDHRDDNSQYVSGIAGLGFVPRDLVNDTLAFVNRHAASLSRDELARVVARDSDYAARSNQPYRLPNGVQERLRREQSPEFLQVLASELAKNPPRREHPGYSVLRERMAGQSPEVLAEVRRVLETAVAQIPEGERSPAMIRDLQRTWDRNTQELARHLGTSEIARTAVARSLVSDLPTDNSQGLSQSLADSLELFVSTVPTGPELIEVLNGITDNDRTAFLAFNALEGRSSANLQSLVESEVAPDYKRVAISFLATRPTPEDRAHFGRALTAYYRTESEHPEVLDQDLAFAIALHIGQASTASIAGLLQVINDPLAIAHALTRIGTLDKDRRTSLYGAINSLDLPTEPEEARKIRALLLQGIIDQIASAEDYTPVEKRGLFSAFLSKLSGASASEYLLARHGALRGLAELVQANPLPSDQSLIPVIQRAFRETTGLNHPLFSNRTEAAVGGALVALRSPEALTALAEELDHARGANLENRTVTLAIALARGENLPAPAQQALARGVESVKSAITRLAEADDFAELGALLTRVVEAPGLSEPLAQTVGEGFTELVRFGLAANREPAAVIQSLEAIRRICSVASAAETYAPARHICGNNNAGLVRGFQHRQAIESVESLGRTATDPEVVRVAREVFRQLNRRAQEPVTPSLRAVASGRISPEFWRPLQPLICALRDRSGVQVVAPREGVEINSLTPEQRNEICQGLNLGPSIDPRAVLSREVDDPNKPEGAVVPPAAARPSGAPTGPGARGQRPQ